MYGNKSTTDTARQMLTQTAGTLVKTREMLDANDYCIDIIQQIDSMVGTLNKAKSELLTGHLECCIKREFASDANKTIKELLRVYKLSGT